MGLTLDILDREAGPVDVTWNSHDALLYALGVGAGQSDASAELELTTENSSGVVQQMLPTFAIVLGQREDRLRIDLGDIDRTKLVHAEQELVLERPLPVEGAVRLRSQVVDVVDKGSGALIVTEIAGTDPADGSTMFTSRMTAFLKGAGGFGRAGQPKPGWVAPEGPPDVVVPLGTRPDQALLYRLSGDRNPLHSDPDFAARGGFPRPILHGLCTFGATARVLINAVCGGDPGRLRAISGRFTRPVFPGDQLEVRAWTSQDGTHLFHTSNTDGAVVIDRGVLSIR